MHTILKMRLTRLTSIPTYFKSNTFGFFFLNQKFVVVMIQWLPWGRKKSFQEQAKKAYTFVIHTPYLHILIYTYILPTFQPHTAPSYYITKLWIKHEKKIMVHQSCQRFSRLSDIMQFVNKPLPLISCTLAIQSPQCYIYIYGFGFLIYVT